MFTDLYVIEDADQSVYKSPFSDAYGAVWLFTNEALAEGMAQRIARDSRDYAPPLSVVGASLKQVQDAAEFGLIT